MRILFAEDDYASRKFVYSFLKNYGEVDITVNGEEAVSAYRLAVEDGERYDLICLDIMMPIMDGIEALYQIRKFEEDIGIEEEKKAKILMISALSEEYSVEQGIEGKYDAYLNKPLDVRKVEAFLSKSGLFMPEKDT